MLLLLLLLLAGVLSSALCAARPKHPLDSALDEFGGEAACGTRTHVERRACVRPRSRAARWTPQGDDTRPPPPPPPPPHTLTHAIVAVPVQVEKVGRRLGSHGRCAAHPHLHMVWGGVKTSAAGRVAHGQARTLGTSPP